MLKLTCQYALREGCPSQRLPLSFAAMAMLAHLLKSYWDKNVSEKCRDWHGVRILFSYAEGIRSSGLAAAASALAKLLWWRL